MRQTRAILVPTRTTGQEMPDSRVVPPFALRKLASIADRHAKAAALDHERGVSIAMGTDLSISGAELANSWGRNGRELPLLVEAGLTPLDAIQAATANGPLTLGPQGAPQRPARRRIRRRSHHLGRRPAGRHHHPDQSPARGRRAEGWPPGQESTLQPDRAPLADSPGLLAGDTRHDSRCLAMAHRRLPHPAGGRPARPQHPRLRPGPGRYRAVSCRNSTSWIRIRSTLPGMPNRCIQISSKPPRYAPGKRRSSSSRALSSSPSHLVRLQAALTRTRARGRRSGADRLLQATLTR